MALTKCRECGGQVSTEATACPHCGAVPTRRGRGTRTPLISFVVVGLIVWVLVATWHSGTPQAPKAGASEPTTVNFNAAVRTKRGALYCPLSAALDEREGYGLKAAMNAHLEIIDHEKDVERLGCEELRAGLPVFLSTDARRRAQRWQAEGKCGMVDDNDGFIFSCDLENDPQGLAPPPSSVDSGSSSRESAPQNGFLNGSIP